MSNPWERIPHSVLTDLVEESAESGHSLRTLCIAWLLTMEDHLQSLDLTPQPETPALHLVPTGSVQKQIMFKLISEALHKTGGNQRKASAMLGIPKSTINDYVRRMRDAIGQ